MADGVYYGVNYTFLWGEEYVTAYKYDINDRNEIGSVNLDASFLSSCLTYDKTTSTVYGCFQNPEPPYTFWFGKADYGVPPSLTLISEIPESVQSFNAMFTDDEGQVYAIDMSGDLYKVDKSDGMLTKVGATGFVPKYACGATFDSKTGKAYWSLAPDDEYTYLIEIDPATASGREIYRFEHGEEITGLAMAVLADDKAPGAPTSLSLDFGAELTGTVSFTMPETLYDGTVASGEVGYAITAGGKTVCQGSAAYGAAVTETVTVPSPGEQTISVFCVNDAGEGPRASVRRFMGKDIPSTPENITATWADGVFTVAWDPVTGCLNGGYVDPDAIRYTVVRMPDEVTVAENISETYVKDRLSEPSDSFINYYYCVTASYDDMESYPGFSPVTGLGSVVPPYLNNMDEDSAFSELTVIDANEDGRSWLWNYGDAQCCYHETNRMDDYLVLPPMRLEGGKAYLFSMDAWSDWPERVEVVYGSAAAPESMTNTICPPTEIHGETPVKVEGYVMPAQSGVYHIAIHGISDPDMHYLFVDNITVSGASGPGAPGPVTEIGIVGDANDFRKASVSFTTPEVTISGTALDALTKIEVYRDETLVRTFDNPGIGRSVTFDDEVDVSSVYRYTFIPYNGDGIGKSASQDAFIGINVPGEPSGVTAAETSVNGEVTISWTAPEVDCDGNPIDSSLIDYTIVEYNYGDYIPVADGVTGTSYTYRAVAEGEPQAMKQYAVFGHTESGTGNGSLSELIAVGEPYAIPYEENFAEMHLDYILGMNVLEGYPEWSLYDPSSFVDVESDATGDNGFIAMSGESYDDCSMIFTGKISLAGAENPTLSFYVYNIGNNDDVNEISVMAREAGDMEFVELRNIIMNEACAGPGWNRLSVSLDAYRGKTVQIGLKAIIHGYTFVLMDGIRLADVYPDDLRACKITAPSTVRPDTSFDVEVIVENIGTDTASGYTVELYRDGDLVAERDGETVAPNGKAAFTFSQVLNAANQDESAYKAVVNYATDGNLSDNTTESVTVGLKRSGLPTPTGLVSSEGNGSVILKWTAPDLSTAVVEVNEDFEDRESFATQIEGWTFVDADGGDIGRFRENDLPLNIQGPQSFWVHDSTWEDFINNPTFASSFATHSGVKCLASMYRVDGGAVDDWAISPLLTGKAQTISFYARSYDDWNPETVEVLYSTEGTDIEDFRLVETFSALPSEWTLYEFDVPDGARYFAIRSVAADAFMLMVDDVSYLSGEASNLTLMGYNIYRDGVRVNPEILVGTEYTDVNVDGAGHRYDVSAVYAEGESRTVSVNTGNVGTGSGSMSGVRVYSVGEQIVIYGASGQEVGVFTLDGKCMFQGYGRDSLSVPVGKGIYLVRVRGSVFKILVK